MSERVAILASGDRKSGGGGSTAERVARDALEQKVGFNIGVVICNNPEGTVGVYPRFDQINKDFGLKSDDCIKVETINSKDYPGGPFDRGITNEESLAICRTLVQYDIDFVFMLGYMKKLNGAFVEEWGWKPSYGIQDPTFNGKYHPKARISNDHPSILPFTADTHGDEAHRKALRLYRQGVITRSAMTWHMGSAELDTGAVIHEEPVPILKSDRYDRLGKRVQKVEKNLTAVILDRHLKLRAEHLRVAA